jgi:starvation-inducible DNA-binding protein
MKNNSKINGIGLDIKLSQQLIEKLNKLLANYQLMYINTRGYHWNIKGEKFFELHLKFEELYTDFQLKIDEVAERILTLGGTPVHSYSQYLKLSEVKEKTNISAGKKAVEDILSNFKLIISLQREILDLSSEANDEGTNALMSDYIREQEKLVWMYSSFLG